MGVEGGEGSNRWRTGALRADWTKRGRVWILPFVAKLHNGKSIGAGRAAAAPRDPPGTPGRPRTPPPRSAGPSLRSRGTRRGPGRGVPPPPPPLPREPPVCGRSAPRSGAAVGRAGAPQGERVWQRLRHFSLGFVIPDAKEGLSRDLDWQWAAGLGCGCPMSEPDLWPCRGSVQELGLSPSALPFPSHTDLWVTFTPKLSHRVSLRVEIQNPCSALVPS